MGYRMLEIELSFLKFILVNAHFIVSSLESPILYDYINQPSTLVLD